MPVVASVVRLGWMPLFWLKSSSRADDPSRAWLQLQGCCLLLVLHTFFVVAASRCSALIFQFIPDIFQLETPQWPWLAVTTTVSVRIVFFKGVPPVCIFQRGTVCIVYFMGYYRHCIFQRGGYYLHCVFQRATAYIGHCIFQRGTACIVSLKYPPFFPCTSALTIRPPTMGYTTAHTPQS